MVNNFQRDKIQLLKDGIYLCHRAGEKVKRIADPILVTAFATKSEGTQHEQAFVKIKFRNRRGRWKRELLLSSMLTGHNNDFVALLATRGYLWPPNRKLWPKIIAALSVVKADHHIQVVDLPGWHRGCVVLPDEAYTPRGPNRTKFLIRHNSTVKLGRYWRSGTLDQWQKIARLCCHSSRARCLMAAAFTAPNLRSLKIPSFGLNLSGETTTAKTSLIGLASSAPGLNSNEGPDTWDGTAAAYEQRALGHRDSIMPLDDLGHVVGDPAEVAKLITFRLASNRPKAKAGQYLAVNNLIDGEFRVIALSTSEDPIWDHLRSQQRGRRVRGEQVRMINLRACVSKLGDVFDGPKADRCVGTTIEERARTIEQYAKLAVKYQGEAYRLYLAKRVADKAAEQTLRKYMADYFDTTPLAKQYRWIRRIARYFAAIYASAALAIDYGILPWSKKSTLTDIRTCMDDAINQLIANFESEPNVHLACNDIGQLELIKFKKLIDEANFVALDHGAEKKKAITKLLKKADGFIRRDKSGSARTFLFSKTFERWYPDAGTRKPLAKYLRSHRIFGKGRRSDTCTREIFVAALGGKVACYVLSRKQLRRSTTKGPTARRCGQAIPGRGRPTTAKMPSWRVAG